MKKENSLPCDWEKILEMEMLKNQSDKCIRRGYICSPCKDDNFEAVYQNMQAARVYMYFAIMHLHINARATHAYLPTLLCDKLPCERALAIQFCKKLVETGVIILVCGDRLTSGMREEICHAAALGEQILVFNTGILTDVKKLVTGVGADKKLVSTGKCDILGYNTADIDVLLNSI